MITKLTGLLFAVLLLVYMAWPSPSSINSFPALPNSSKSQEAGDTYQVSNVAAYFSLYYRNYVTNFYRNDLQRQEGLPFPPLTLNHPPEFAFTAIKDQTQSTYLEQYVYPLRSSLFVNGFEPFYENGQPKFMGATDMVVDGHFYKTKTTLRYYPAKLSVRLLTWFGICASVVGLWYIGRKILRNG